MVTKKEEFLQTWVDAVKESSPEALEEDVRQVGSEVWLGRELSYAVVDDDFSLLAHRYFHGMGRVRLQLILMTLPEDLTYMLPLVLAESSFADGFLCGIAHARGWDVDKVAPAEEAAGCLSREHEYQRVIRLKTREELDQDDALPTGFAPFGRDEEDIPL